MEFPLIQKIIKKIITPEQGYDLGLSHDEYERILAREEVQDEGKAKTIRALSKLYIQGDSYIGNVLQSISSIILSLVSIVLQSFTVTTFPASIPIGVVFAIILAIILIFFSTYFKQTSISTHQMNRIDHYGLVSRK
ncbi:MAG TPA: hypothetical protein VH796_04150 [Nitrososphaeraceae archaeon]